MNLVHNKLWLVLLDLQKPNYKANSGVSITALKSLC